MTHLKVKQTHLNRKAVIYIRQSSLHQVLEHEESQRRQYQLVALAESLGWAKSACEIVDDYEKRNYTFLISQILYSSAFRGITREDDLPALDDLLSFVHSSNVIGETLKLSSLYFDLADVLAKEIDCAPIRRYVAHYQKVLETLEGLKDKS